jgi:sugar lactone lactonase YvrE
LNLGGLARTLGGLIALLLCGCSQPGVIFGPLANAPRWPLPPDTLRISCVGQIQTSADLKPGRTFFELLGEALFGKKDTQAMLSPMAACLDQRQRLFVADSNAQVVHVFDLDSRRYAQVRPAEPARFSQPVGIACDRSGRLFVADSVGGVVYTFDEEGDPLGILGPGILNRPCGLAVDEKSGRVLVVDTAAHQVAVFDREGKLVTRIGRRGKELGQFNFPTYAALDRSGRLYVSDSLNFRVQQFSPDYKPLRQIGSQGDMPGFFASPKGIACDSEGHLYVVDAQFEAIQVFDDGGQLLLSFGSEGRGPGEFWLPNALFIDPTDRLWVADVYNKRVQVFQYHREARP